jgi:hypothetical protein
MGIPTSSLLFGTTGWTGRHEEPKRPTSADWMSLCGHTWENTRIYETSTEPESRTAKCMLENDEADALTLLLKWH